MSRNELKQRLYALREQLEQAQKPASRSCLVGFDGFVDYILDVVDKRSSFTDYRPIGTITGFGERIVRAAGLSTNLELVSKTVKLGGNGPIMCNALMEAGVQVHYVGALGKPAVDPVFEAFAGRCQSVTTLADPGYTNCLEFSDGKVMLGKPQSLNSITWSSLLAEVGRERLQEWLRSVDLIATVNWTMIAHMNEIWDGLQAELARLPSQHKPLLFVDLADPEKRSNEDLRAAMACIARFSPHCRTVLGLNRKEASAIADVMEVRLGVAAADADLADITQALAQALDVWGVVVHPTTGAAAVCDGSYAYTDGPYTSKPRLTTGAGDNFNAGFCLALILDLPVDMAVIMGKATSGYYVRNMRSPSFDELKVFVGRWAEHVGEDF